MTKLDYGVREGKGLSYSRQCALHTCARSFQLSEIYNIGGEENNTDFAFGHAVGAGVQSLVAGDGEGRALVATASAWDIGLDDEDNRSKKSLTYAILAVQKLATLMRVPATNPLSDFEIATFTNNEGKLQPAIELTFKITCWDGYIYEGHIDLILRNKLTGKYLVLELKTTKFVNLHEAMYKNSGQAVGYSVVLDSIVDQVGGENAYSVLYLVYKCGHMEYEPMVFPKTPIDKSRWVNALVMDIEILKLYEEYNTYPKNGANCYDFFRECKYYDICDYQDSSLKKLGIQVASEDDKYAEIKQHDFEYTLDNIIARQEKNIAEVYG